jgi:nucleotide-binding universal stress UspA family protein
VEEASESLFWLPHERSESEEAAREVTAHIGALAEPLGVIQEVIVKRGPHAAPEIVRVARERDADLIVLSGNLRPTQRFHLGSTVAYVLRHTTCAVAVLRP